MEQTTEWITSEGEFLFSYWHISVPIDQWVTIHTQAYQKESEREHASEN